jgi:hypothetical protein
MRTFFLFITFISSLYAFNINESLLNMHATLLPKIYLMDYNFQKKSLNKTIAITILYERSEYKGAQFLKKQILKKYANGIKSYKLNVQLVNYNKLNNTHANMYYMFPSNKKHTLKAVEKANKENAITFAYDKEDLKYGIMISLEVDKKTKPLLNLEAIRENNISLRPILIDISVIYSNTTQRPLNSIRVNHTMYYFA